MYVCFFVTDVKTKEKKKAIHVLKLYHRNKKETNARAKAKNVVCVGL